MIPESFVKPNRFTGDSNYDRNQYFRKYGLNYEVVNPNNFCCSICREKLIKPKHENLSKVGNFHVNQFNREFNAYGIEHDIDLKLGGVDRPINFSIAHVRCNIELSGKKEIDFNNTIEVFEINVLQKETTLSYSELQSFFKEEINVHKCGFYSDLEILSNKLNRFLSIPKKHVLSKERLNLIKVRR